jgi:hypothetical protein
MTHPDIQPAIGLRLAVKAMNDTIGEDGLVPSLLVFGISPRHQVLSTNLPTQQERMKVLATANAEMNSIIAERRILTALQKSIPAASVHSFDIGDEVLVFRERTDSWEGPYRVTAIEGKIVTIFIKDAEKRFSAHQVKIFVRNEDQTSFSKELQTMFSASRSHPRPVTPPVNNTYLTEVIHPGDPRACMFSDAKQKGIRGLLDRGTFEIVYKNSVPKKANVLGGRFVLALKDEGTPKEVWKARFVVQGYRDEMKTSLVHDAVTSKQHSSRMMLELPLSLGSVYFN